jgi:2-dehydro-3-deoxyglucarate aldolase
MNKVEKIKSIREKLRAQKVSIGSWMQIPNGSVAEIMGMGGYDWVAVDLEHGSFGHHQLPDIFRALELGDTLPLARLAEGKEKDCKQALDAGAGGVIVPMIESAEQLVAVKNFCRWPPAGKRGVGFSRANLFGRHFAEYHEEAQAPLLVAMIESIKAVDKLEQILEVSGLDALFIGPYDLSASLNATGDFENEKFKTAMRKIQDSCKRHGVCCGLHVVNPSEMELNRRIDEGFTFLAYSLDSVFLERFSKSPTK